jgi:hypothetical protein
LNSSGASGIAAAALADNAVAAMSKAMVEILFICSARRALRAGDDIRVRTPVH